ncbi:hypothetical protein TNCV_1568291 [Trichonephila clavipes]|nr:hypothetical protein TNCV_1568291 [Trichonephila clavipes]
MGGRRSPRYNCSFYICPVYRKRITKEFGGASGSTDLMAGKVMFLRSNQGGRLDGNESVADSFRSDLVGFKSWSRRIIGAFYSLLRLPEKPSSREAHSLPEVTPPSPSDPLIQISNTLVTFNVSFTNMLIQ